MPSANQPAKPAAALPTGIEIFRAGRHTDDSGTVHEFSQADVRATAAAYNPSLREAPLTIGHPAHDLPAYGYVRRLDVNGDGRLAMDTHQVPPQFAEMVQAGSFKKRSASFYPPSHPNNPVQGTWYLRHVAFLGAQPPAIHGLADIQFSEGDADGAVSFSEPVTTTTQESDDMSKELQAQLDEANKQLAIANAAAVESKRLADEATAATASFAERARKDRTATFVSFSEAQVKAGKLLPKDKDMAVATQEALADATPVSFSEGGTTRSVTPLQWLQELIVNAKPVVNFGEFATGTYGTQVTDTKGKTDAEIDAQDKAYARDKKVSYAEALTAIATFTS